MRFCTFTVFLALCCATAAHALNESPPSFTLDGTLLAADHISPLLDSTVKVRVQILNPAKTCVLYDEEQTVNTFSSNGRFNIQVGSAVGAAKRKALDSANTMARVYQNASAIPAQAAPSQTCVGSSYTPAAGDIRYVRVIVTPTSASPETLTPDMVLDAVPNAVVAQSLQGVEKAGFLQVNSGAQLSQAKLEQFMQVLTAVPWMSVSYDGTNFVTFDPADGSTLTAGSVTDTQISNVQWSKVTSVPPAIAAVAGLTCTNGEILKFVSGAWACGTESGVGVESDPTVSLFAKTTPGAGLTTDGSNHLIPDFGTGAGKVVQGNDSRLSDSRAPNGSASGDLSGSYPSPTVAKLQGRGVSVTAPADGQVLRYNNGTSQWEPYNFGIGDLKTSLGTSQFISASCTASETLIWSSVTNTFSCTTIAISASQVTGNIAGNAANVTGTVAIANGGTGQTTATAAFNALAPSQSSQNGKFLTTNGTTTSWASALTSESDPKVGTNTTNYLSKWNGSALVASGVFENSGNIGIGTTSPSTSLHVVHDSGTALTGLTAYGGIHLDQSGTNDDFVGITTSATTTGTQGGILLQGSGAYGTKIHFLTTNSYAAGMAQRMIIDHLGNVGIGTTVPSAKLDVSDGTLSIFKVDTVTSSWIGGGNNLILNASKAAADTVFKLQGTERMRITSAGRVGIGTDTPTAKLEIGGTAGVDGIKFPDGTTQTTAATGAGSGPITIYKSADESVVSSVTLQDDDQLQFPMAANTKYRFEFVLFRPHLGNPDFKATLAGPGAPNYLRAYANMTVTSASFEAPITSYGTLYTVSTSGNYEVSDRIVGTVENGATAGNLRLQWAQNTSSATAATIYRGSFVTYQVIP